MIASLGSRSTAQPKWRGKSTADPRIGFLGCSGETVRDVIVADPWVRAVESAYSNNIWSERVHVRQSRFLHEYFSN